MLKKTKKRNIPANTKRLFFKMKYKLFYNYTDSSWLLNNHFEL